MPAFSIQKLEIEIVARPSLEAAVEVLGDEPARGLQAGHARPGGDVADGCVAQLPPDRLELLEGLRHERGLKSYDQPSCPLAEQEQKPTERSVVLHGVPFVRHLVVGAMKYPGKQASFVKMEDLFFY